MLAYVYGVVPISLCRSGGCGVSAGNGKGVRIEFDDENDINVGGPNTAIGKSFKQKKKHVYFHCLSFVRPHCSHASSDALPPSSSLRQGLTV